MSVKEFLESLVVGRAPGPRASFSVFDVIKVLEIIAESGLIGRGKLSERLGLGEGTTRTLVSRLTDAKLISTSRGGCSLTEKGEKIWSELKAILPIKVELGKNELTLATYSVAALVKNRGERVKKGLEQRDAAVRAGAKGAITLVFKKDKLILPTISADLSKDFPVALKQITQLMKLEENDVVVISGADQRKEAEYGALAAAWSII